jgi:uncharacterized protein YjdB
MMRRSPWYPLRGLSYSTIGGRSAARGARAAAVLAIVGVIAAACSDPVGVAPSPAAELFAYMPEGDPNGASPPAVTHVVENGAVTICASWTDVPLAPGTKLSFSFHQLSTSNSDYTVLGTVELRKGADAACITGPLLGTQYIRVVGMARKGGGPNASIVTTQPTIVQVVVGYTIALVPASATILPGATQQLTATVYQHGVLVIENPPEVAWSSSNPSVATVSSSGLVTGAGVGVATIRAALAADPAIFAEATVSVAS